uniref:Basement membrane-specific heparan sulfate proteoglycan core protein n=1 Tax=Panagrolaimus sp. PS1159 TaxID=55785 RepID=A0AC35F5Y3_9BILA
SFLAIPPPRNIKNFSFGLNIKLKDSTKDQVIAYLGSNYNQKTAEFMTLAIKNGKFVNIYQNGGGKSVVESFSNLENGKTYRVELSRNGHVAEMTINGAKTTSKVKTVAFPSGTSLFIGGFPPGMEPQKHATAYGFFEGCVGEIDVEGKRIEIDEMENVFSGDLGQCNPESRGEVVGLEQHTTEMPDRVQAYNGGRLTIVTTEEPSIVGIHETSEEKIFVHETKERGTGGGWSSEEGQEATLGTEKPLDRLEERVTVPLVTVTIPTLSTTTTTIETTTIETTTSVPLTTTTTTEMLTEEPMEDVAVALPVDDSQPSESPPEAPKALCEENTCGPHGECEVVNATHVVCQCKDYYDGPNCENFKPIEHAAMFSGNAYIVFSADDFPHLTSEREETISFRLKTTAKYGVIFWQGQHPDSNLAGEDYISIGLSDGYLVYSYELGGGAAQIISTNQVNDGHEHIIIVERRGRNGTLTIDNEPKIFGTSSGILAMLNVEGNIYIGGVPDLELMTAGLHSHNLVGCVADVLLNHQKMDLMANAIDGVNVKPCDSWRKSNKKKWMKSRKYRRLVIG